MSGGPAYSSKLTLHDDQHSRAVTGPGPSDTSDADDERLRVLVDRLARPVVSSLLSPAELQQLSVHWDQDRTSEDTWVRVVACGEVFQDWLTSATWGSSTATVAAGLRAVDLPLCAARLADHLQDWIAESRFGWGQQRTARYTLPG